MSTNRGKFLKIILSHTIIRCNNNINSLAYNVSGGDIMGFFNCNCRTGCTALGLIVSLIAGIVALVLNITGTITVLPLFLWIGFGVAVGLLIVTLLIVASTDEERRERNCICKALSTLQLGALGAILTALILLAVDFGGISIIGAILYGSFIFFFVLLITSVICLARCYASCDN